MPVIWRVGDKAANDLVIARTDLVIPPTPFYHRYSRVRDRPRDPVNHQFSKSPPRIRQRRGNHNIMF